MSPVFRHGQLRIYLLSLLDEEPRTGYEVIKALEERFGGTYTPSAGTIYPRLAKLAEEGLVVRTDEGRTALYTITDPGRAEVRGRADEVDAIDDGIDSAAAAADAARHAVRTATADLKREIRDAAQRARVEARTEARRTPGPSSDRFERAIERTLRGLDREMRALERAALRVARRAPSAAEELEGALADAELRLAEATARVEAILDR